MRIPARACALLLGLSIVLAACGSPSPNVTPVGTPAPSGPTPTPAATTPTPTDTPTPSPTPSQAPGDLSRVSWAFVQPVAASSGKVDYTLLYLGFAGKPASAAIRVEKGSPKYQLAGDLALVIANLGGKTAAFRIFRVADGSVFWDAAKANVGIPDGSMIYDPRSNTLYFSALTDAGGIEFHRLNTVTGADDMLLAFGRPFGETWADQDHSHSAAIDLARPGYVHYVVCTNGLDRAACTFYVAGPKDKAATKEAVVTGNSTALCHIIGADAHYAFTVEVSGKCSPDEQVNENASVRVTDLTTGRSRPVLNDSRSGRGTSLTRPQAVETSAGIRLVYAIVPKKSQTRVLAAYDPVRDAATVLPFTIDHGVSVDPARAIVLMLIVGSPIQGRVLVAPVLAANLSPVTHSLWGADTPKPAFVDVLTGAATKTDVWDPGKLAPTP